MCISHRSSTEQSCQLYSLQKWSQLTQNTQFYPFSQRIRLQSGYQIQPMRWKCLEAINYLISMKDVHLPPHTLVSHNNYKWYSPTLPLGSWNWPPSRTRGMRGVRAPHSIQVYWRDRSSVATALYGRMNMSTMAKIRFFDSASLPCMGQKAIDSPKPTSWDYWVGQDPPFRQKPLTQKKNDFCFIV